MKGLPLLHIILLLSFILILKIPANVSGLTFENNPFYGLSYDPIRSVESITDDNLIKVKLEYAPSAIQIGSPEFFRATCIL